VDCMVFTGDIRPVLGDMVDFIAKDHQGGMHNPDFPVPGEGEVDFANLFRQMHTAGFDGSVVIEKVENKGEALSEAQIGERILRARLNMERLLQKAGFEPEGR